MVSRPFKCPLCSSAFRNESGMSWHIAHRHEVPAAFEALHQRYQAEEAAQREEYSRIKNELEQMQIVLAREREERRKEQIERIEDGIETIKLRQDLQKAVAAIIARDIIIKENLGVQMPYPFASDPAGSG